MGWIERKDTGRIKAFYGSIDAYNQIPGWDEAMPSMDHAQPHTRLDHGYDETRVVLELKDLQQAAVFRGGELVSNEWSGNMNQPLSWICCQKHPFKMTPHAVLKGGHWCLECIAPPWNQHLVVDKNPFAAQVLSVVFPTSSSSNDDIPSRIVWLRPPACAGRKAALGSGVPPGSEVSAAK